MFTLQNISNVGCESAGLFFDQAVGLLVLGRTASARDRGVVEHMRLAVPAGRNTSKVASRRAAANGDFPGSGRAWPR